MASYSHWFGRNATWNSHPSIGADRRPALRTRQYQEATARAVDKQSAAFESVFPNQSIPVGILTRMQSEQRRLSGTRGLSSEAIPKLQSIVPITHAFLSSLPERDSARFRFDRVEFIPSKIVSAVGVAKSIEDQELIGESLRIAGLVVPPMSVQSNREGVTLRLSDIKLSKPESKKDESDG